MEFPKSRLSLLNKFRRSLFFRLSFLVIAFTVALVLGLYYQFNYLFTTQDSLLDAHEAYYYSEMVEGWGTPPDTAKILEDIKNLHLNCAVYSLENDYTEDSGYGPVFWAFPPEYRPEIFYAWSYIEDFEQHEVEIPLHVQFGNLGESPATAVENEPYVYYLEINYQEPSDLPNFILAIFLTIIFIISLSFFIRRYLYPVHLMKQRVIALESGDLKSEIPILGQDELASLSKALNKLISDIRYLLNQKQQLLLDVSHELRTPLARMQLLLELTPKHKNIPKLKKEVNLLEGMISNLLLSDRLSTPYQNLELNEISIERILANVIDMFPDSEEILKLIGEIPNIKINVDEMKFTLAIRNLIDNAHKYAKSEKRIEVSSLIKDGELLINIQDFGPGISAEDIKKITAPFYRIKENNKFNRSGFGLGLTICKKAIEAHNGHLSIESNINMGSKFTLHYPLK